MAIILLLCASFFALAETALASASKNKIKIASDRGDSRAKNALFLMDKFDDAISTLLICTNIVHIAAAAIVTEAVVRAFGMSAVTASTLITTIVVFFFGEMLPKSIAKKNSEKFLLSTATIVKFFMYVFLPVEKFLTFMGQLVAKLMKGDSEISVTEDELYDMIEDMEEQGHINEEQSDLISSALQFGELTVESILTPRVDIAAIDIEDKPEDIYKFIKKQNHSRIPVYKDTTDNIIGILQIRKFLKAYVETKKLPTTKAIKGMLDDVYYTPMTTKIDELLPLLSQNKTNIAVVT
ncbi:MAG: HlyC/CorC family transporter, partial [Lachnospiraceae bacterium]|nr:HlyC/CorC family transporter [Lachnospiraceae bacterium]